MKTNELLEKHPLTTEVVRTWFFDQMTASFADENVPEEFKEMMKQEGVTNERLSILIDAQPRTLFDVFDDNKLYIHIEPFCDGVEKKLKSFGYRMLFKEYLIENMNFKTRKEAELFAIAEAFDILEEQLKPIDLPALEEN